MRKPTLFSLLFAAFLIATPQQTKAQASVEVGPRIGIDVGDIEEFFIGADARISVTGLPVKINPTFDYYFVDFGSYFALSGNALYPLGVENEVFTPYAGGGIGLFRADPDVGGSATDPGINIVGGAEFIGTNFRPFVQAQISIVFSDPDNTSLFGITGGLLF